MIDKSEITAVILAGGRGQRMGGTDKGLVAVAGKPLVEHVLGIVACQAGQVIISANRNHERYQAFGHPVLADTLAGYQGPLAGLLAGMRAARTPYLATVPCDGPFLGANHVARLAAALEAAQADIAIAHDGHRLQPVHALVRTALRADLEGFLAAGERKTALWQARHRCAHADFSDAPQQFFNLNTPGDRLRFENRDDGA